MIEYSENIFKSEEQLGCFLPLFKGSVSFLSKFPHQDRLIIPENLSSLPVTKLFEDLCIYKSIDSGMFFMGPIGTLMYRNLEGLIREKASEFGYIEITLPSVHKSNWLDKCGIGELYKQQIFKFEQPRDFIMAATTEEPLLKFLQGSHYSYKQFPLKFFIFNDVHRWIPRAEGFYSSRQIRTCVMPRLDIDKNLYISGVKDFACFCKDVFESIGIHFESFFADDFSAVEIFTSSKLADRNISESVCFRKGFSRSNQDVKSDKKLTSLAMLYPYKHINDFNITYTDLNGNKCIPYMSTSGIGLQRVLLSIFEQNICDGFVSIPHKIRPFDVSFICLSKPNEDNYLNISDLCRKLKKIGMRVICDDRQNVMLKDKLRFCDFFGIPIRIIYGNKERINGAFELRIQGEEKFSLNEDELIKRLANF